MTKISTEYCQDLWHRFRNGDPEAFTILMKEFSNPLYRYGIRLNNNDEFIKDCIQDVFFELWNHKDNISQTPAVKSYLIKALRFRIFREQKKWSNSSLISENYNFLVEFSIEDSIIEEQGNVENKLKIERMLNSLPKRQKEILYLRFFESQDNDQIAQIMGLRHQSVYNLVHDAINRIRKEWMSEVLLLVYLFADL